VIDVEAVARTFLPTDARQSAVEAVAQPVEDEAQIHKEQRAKIVAGQGIEDAGANLGGEAEQGELVRGQPKWSVFGQPV
jgi:hypothetical protein